MPASTKLRSSRRATNSTSPLGTVSTKISSVDSSRTCTPDIGTSAEDEIAETARSGSPDSEGEMKVTRTNGKVDGDRDTFDEDDVYGLDGGLIGRNRGVANVPKRESSAAVAAKAVNRSKDQAILAMIAGGIERDGARGIPVPIPSPSLNLLRNLQDQLGSLGIPFGNGSKNPLGSFEKWGRSWFNVQGRSVRAPGSRSAERDDEEDEADDTDGVDGYALVKDRKCSAGSPPKQSINGLGNTDSTSLGGPVSFAIARRRSEMSEFDMGDGKGLRPGLFEFHPTQTTALRIWDCGSVGEAGLGGRADIQESLVWDSGPKEVGCFEAVQGEWTLDAAFSATKAQMKAWLIRLVLSAVDDRGIGCVRLEKVDPVSGQVMIIRECGRARSGKLAVSSKFLVVATGGDTLSVVIFDKDTLRPHCRSIQQDLGVNTRSGVPVIALQGRLLAYLTSEPAKPGPERYARMEELKHGTIVTKRSVKAAVVNQKRQKEGALASSSASESRFSPESLPSMQAMVLNTATGISSEVAKGVWSGLKGFGRAALDGASRSEALSKSAPAVSDLAKRFAGDATTKDPAKPDNKRSLSGHAGAMDSLAMPDGSSRKRYEGSSWIKVVDLGRLIKSRRVTGSDEEADQYRPSLVAHFAVPVSENVSLPGHDLAAVDLLSFSHNGTHLAVANADGRTVSVLEVRLTAPMSLADFNGPMGQVWLRHDLRRGVTRARIVQVAWNRTGSLISVGSRKTIHVFDLGTDADCSKVNDGGNNGRSLSAKSTTAVKIRTSEWSEPDPTVQARLHRSGVSTLCFLGTATDKTVQAESSVVVYDPYQRLSGKVSIFKLAKRPSEQREELLPVTMALWRLPKEGAAGIVKRKADSSNGSQGKRDRSIHPFAQVEVTTFSATWGTSSIYKDRMFTFSVTSSAKFDHMDPVEYRKQVEVSGDPEPQHSIQSALAHELDPSRASPVIPALPNGVNGRSKTHWRVQPISVMASAVKGHRQRPKYASIGKPNSYSDTQGQDTGSGFLVDVRDDEDASPPSSLEENQESWEDDLIAGIMDV